MRAVGARAAGTRAVGARAAGVAGERAAGAAAAGARAAAAGGGTVILIEQCSEPNDPCVTINKNRNKRRAPFVDLQHMKAHQQHQK